MKLKKLLILLSYSLCLLGSCFAGGDKKRPPNLFLVPDGYVGWLEVQYGVKDAPALTVKGGYRLYKFPRTGFIKTSSPQLYGLAKDKICYLTPKGQKELFRGSEKTKAMVWGDRYTGGDEKSGPYTSAQYVFIGSWKQFQKVEDNPPWLHR